MAADAAWVPTVHRPVDGVRDSVLVRSGGQFGEIGPPPALTSSRYTRDFNEVKALGGVISERTTEQTDTALFYSGNPLIQFNAALRDQVIVRELDIVDAARMFAAVDMSLGRWSHFDLVLEVRLRFLAADHGDP
jgi:hypothetical protein